jgi:hypothetical protein
MHSPSMFRLVPALAASLLVAGCDDPGTGADHDADFTRATADQRTRAVVSAFGDDLHGMMSLMFRMLDWEGVCPTISRAGDKVTFQGGCTDDGLRVEGSATLAGSEDGLANATWSDFTLTQNGRALRLDGTASQDERGATITRGGDFDIETDGVSLHFAGTLSRDATRTWAPSADAEISIDGVGTAAIAGSWRGGHETIDGGTLELRGKNTLTVDFTREVTAHCYAATIDGGATDAICFDRP